MVLLLIFPRSVLQLGDGNTGFSPEKTHFYGLLCKMVWFAEVQVNAKQPWSPLQKKEGMAFPSKARLHFSSHPQPKTLTTPSAHRAAEELRGHFCA